MDFKTFISCPEAGLFVYYILGVEPAVEDPHFAFWALGRMEIMHSVLYIEFMATVEAFETIGWHIICPLYVLVF